MVPTKILIVLLALASATTAVSFGALAPRQDDSSSPPAVETESSVPPIVESTDLGTPATDTAVPSTDPGTPTTTVPMPQPTGPSGTPDAQTPFGDCKQRCDESKLAAITVCSDNPTEDCTQACSAYSVAIGDCNTCMLSLDGANADTNSKDTLKDWMERVSWCPTAGSATDTTAGSATNTTICQKECAIQPEIEANCWSEGMYPTSCTTICDKFNQGQSCFFCYGDPAKVPESVAQSYRGMTFWCDSYGCYRECETAWNDINDYCGTEDLCKSNMCSGALNDRLKKCTECMSGAPIDQGFRDSKMKETVFLKDYCEGKVQWPSSVANCADKCDTILVTNQDKCKGNDPATCAEMCSEDNLNAFSSCNTCMQDSMSTFYEQSWKSDVMENFENLNAWCKNEPPPNPPNKNGGNPPKQDPVTVTITRSGATVTVVVNNKAPPAPAAARPTVSGNTGLTVNTSRPVATPRRPSSSPTGARSSAIELNIGPASIVTAFGLVLGILAVAVA